MTPETRRHLDKANDDLAKARQVFDLLHYSDEAARLAYLAAFHAAQALISERTGRSAKTHAGVHSQFNPMVRGDPRVDGELRSFLSNAFDLKTVADYEVGAKAFVSPEEAEAAIATAMRFVACVATLLA